MPLSIEFSEFFQPTSSDGKPIGEEVIVRQITEGLPPGRKTQIRIRSRAGKVVSNIQAQTPRGGMIDQRMSIFPSGRREIKIKSPSPQSRAVLTVTEVPDFDHDPETDEIITGERKPSLLLAVLSNYNILPDLLGLFRKKQKQGHQLVNRLEDQSAAKEPEEEKDKKDSSGKSPVPQI